MTCLALIVAITLELHLVLVAPIYLLSTLVINAKFRIVPVYFINRHSARKQKCGTLLYLVQFITNETSSMARCRNAEWGIPLNFLTNSRADAFPLIIQFNFLNLHEKLIQSDCTYM